MNPTVARSIKKLNILILFFSILLLMLNIFLPLVAIKNPSDPTQTQYFNLNAMRYSDEKQLEELKKDIDEINLYLWVVIIIGIVSFIGLIIKLSNKLNIISNLLMIIGATNIIFCSLSCVYYMFFIKNVIDLNSVLLASIIGPFRVSYISLIFFILLLLASVAYTGVLIPSFLKDLKKSKKSQETKDQKKKDKKTSDSIETNKEKEAVKTQSDGKKYKIKAWQAERLKDFNEPVEKQKEETEKLLFSNHSKKAKEDPLEKKPEPIIEAEKQTKEEIKTPFQKENIKKPEARQFDSETKLSEDTKETKSFEKALTSAIDKKKGISNNTKPEGKQILPQKFNVKCPKCTYIFEAEKNPEGVTKIKCPKCGKEGIIK